jgi:hypothetical protein
MGGGGDAYQMCFITLHTLILGIAVRPNYKACSIKNRTFAIKTSFYSILCTVPFRVVPSTGDTPFPALLPLLECFLELTFCDGAFS